MLSAPTQYALKALLLLADSPEDEYLAVSSISEEADVPAPFLATIVQQLARKGLIATKKGIKGGVRLIREKEGLTFYDVCLALDDPVINNTCLLAKRVCDEKDPCAFHANWVEFHDEILRFLKTSRIF